MADSGGSLYGIPYSVLFQAGGAAAAAYLQNKQANDARAQQAALTTQGQLFSKEQSTQNTALDESKLDPFRQQMAQGKDLTMLDVIARARNSPVRVQAAGKYAGNVPQISGGFSYDMSPQNRSDAMALQGSIRSGQTAPTMTDPKNYGKTSVLNLSNPGGPVGYTPPGATSPLISAPPGTAVPRTPGAADVDLSSSVFGAGGTGGSDPTEQLNPGLTSSPAGGGGSFEDLINMINRQRQKPDDEEKK